MWFRFPKGQTAISVERQNFNIEATDTEGNGYFRAPNHFAAHLAMVGFKALEGKPEGTELDDLPQPDPLRDGAISTLTAQVLALQQEIGDLRSDLTSASAGLKAAALAKNAAEATILELKAKIEDLEERLEDDGLDPKSPAVKK